MGRDSELLASASILVVDDEAGMRNFMCRLLAPRCKRVAEAESAEAAARLLEAEPFDMLLLDNIMEGRHGLLWLQDLRASGYFGEVILISAFADLDTVIQAMREGAADFILKPFRANQILNAITRCLDRAHLRRENFLLKRQLHSLPARDGGVPDLLVGQSPALAVVRDMVERLAPLPTTVLLTGESGTGKEVTARALHQRSPRADKPFVPVNCAAIPAEMIESELFGHLKGAFTGAASSREGLFFYAQGGTLFLDEVAELPLPLQAKLLRVLEDKRVRPVGSERELPVDVRIIAATNVDLEQAAASGQMRRDLFYRLNVVNIHLPPLRERPEDVAPLARQFIAEISHQFGVPPMDLDPARIAELEGYEWPGNIRELRNLIERTIILGDRPRASTSAPVASADPASQTLEAVERAHMLNVLESVGGNRAEAARRLGVSRKTLDRKCAAWNV
ncbi:sigma-54-dependent Fis family transcriptional regulator [Azorhizobium oxalatiphilum]|uniref:Sigma-54-dependent Fis family transcriptional regulator n=1 Tax=Azorhizobium oxalatiphilum TaxID=980631 RepID=A0A917C402_9HYPH|nr:sigma-54 dependent transcriptional regulator [Azorhizobium oxalatiphilum]GGF71138.1 sigma-54-dependent Fis family transcriptional regulator [Azorhizobium oxalatiphilum]